MNNGGGSVGSGGGVVGGSQREKDTPPEAELSSCIISKSSVFSTPHMGFLRSLVRTNSTSNSLLLFGLLGDLPVSFKSSCGSGAGESCPRFLMQRGEELSLEDEERSLILVGGTSGGGVLVGSTSGGGVLVGSTSGGGVLVGGTSGGRVLVGGTSGGRVLVGGTSGGRVLVGGASGGIVLVGGTSGGRVLVGGTFGGGVLVGGTSGWTTSSSMTESMFFRFTKVTVSWLF